MDIEKLKKVHMIGVKGVGMTMLAQFLSSKGVVITGSDTDERFFTDQVLRDAGINVSEGFSAGNIPEDAELIVYSIAYTPENNEEAAAAMSGKIKAVSLSSAIGEVFNRYYGIAVCGSHGKTTTTAWLSYVLERAGLSPNALIGSNVPQLGGTSLAGSSDLMIIEADEYGNKLKFYEPKAVLLNNIDYDHPDFFPTPESYTAVFTDFIKRIPKKGFLVANMDDPQVNAIAGVNTVCKLIGYALREDEKGIGEARPGRSAEYFAYDVRQAGDRQYFRLKLVEEGRSDLGEFAINLSGRHNIYNAVAVIAAAIELGAELFDIRKHLEEFKGTSRRTEILGQYRGALVVDDYAHHPTEVRSTLEGLKAAYPGRRFIAAFHPHTFTRTKALLDDFASCFEAADVLVLLDIYGSAREKSGGVHTQDLIERIKDRSRKEGTAVKDVVYAPTLDDAERYLRDNVRRGDLVVLMGAGDIFRVGQRLVGD